MAKRPNYAQERAERRRRQEARRDERVAAKAARRGKPDAASVETLEPQALPPVGNAAAPMLADPQAMIRLGEALKFVCGADHPTTLAVLRAAANVDRSDIERARVLFQQLAPESQRAALTIAAATPSVRR